ncbi:MAG TPA: gephyrin-like molybdotransferase Glp [Thermoleophilaceae bacterium]|nr:gephyrin-like molybdotransferase Glp [Thermoleophilaceae bacterium]
MDEARTRVLANVRPLAAERVGLDDALGRVLAEDVVAEFELPPFDSSAMDGFAVVAGPAADLPVIGESQAGRPFEGELQPGQAVRISTGAVVPRGADAIVPIERVDVNGDRVRVPDATAGAHLRPAGDDLHRGDRVMTAGTDLGAAQIGMLAGLGRIDVVCAERPRLAIAATGDELVSGGQPLAPGQIYDSNAAAIGAQAMTAGAEVVARMRVEDTERGTVEGIAAAADSADVICITGGVSVGPHDHVKPALAELGFDELLWGVRLKPGKPFWFGVRGEQYAFGLPGNPVSAMVTFTLFARPALRALQGADPSATRSTAVLDGPIAANADRDQAVRCRLRMDDDGWHAEPTGPQGSHVMSSMLGAAALAIVPAGERDLAPGERVAIELI